MVVLFQAAWGVTKFELTATDVPSELVAATEKVYFVPFFKPVIFTGLSWAVIISPLRIFLTS